MRTGTQDIYEEIEVVTDQYGKKVEVVKAYKLVKDPLTGELKKVRC
jgi:hypothetical protein